MKNKLYIALALFVVVLLLAFVFRHLFTPVFDMAVSPPEFPDSIQILHVVKADISPGNVAEIGSRLGMTGKVSEGQENYLMSNNETGAYLMVYKATGAIEYNIPSEFFPEKPPVLPSYEEAAAIATDCLTDIGYLAEGVKVKRATTGGTSNGVPAHILVEYSRPVGQYEFFGGMYSVLIGGGGKVISILANPVKCENYKTVILKPVKQAYNELKKTKSKYSGISALWISIDSISLNYWLGSLSEFQEYVYPVYAFEGHRYPGQGYYNGMVDATYESSIDFPAVE